MRRLTLVVALGALSGGALGAQIALTDPGWPARETAVYTQTLGSTSSTVVASLGWGGSPRRLEYRTTAPEAEATYLIDPQRLLSVASETLTRSPEATVRRTSRYDDLRLTPRPDELVVTDFATLPVVLRGFPWGQRTSAKIVTAGLPAAAGAGFVFELSVVGRDSVKAAGRVWDCWQVTTGLGGAFGVLVPKTTWWFAVDGSHVLVKTSGPSGGPGSPQRTLVLTSLTVDAESSSPPPR